MTAWLLIGVALAVLAVAVITPTAILHYLTLRRDA
jgi:hypothetical protein